MVQQGVGSGSQSVHTFCTQSVYYANVTQLLTGVW
jgi:hypothetical protein